MDMAQTTACWDVMTVKSVTEALGNQVHCLAQAILDMDPVEDREDCRHALAEMRTCLAAMRDIGGMAG